MSTFFSDEKKKANRSPERGSPLGRDHSSIQESYYGGGRSKALPWRIVQLLKLTAK